MPQTQVRGTQVGDKSVKAVDTDFTTAAIKTTLGKDDYIVIINSASTTDDTEIIRASEFVSEVERLNSLTKYQLEGIVGTTKGAILMSDYVGSEIGSYDCEINVDFSDLSNSSYRLTANRKLKFSLTVYQNGAIIYHNVPELVISHASGNIVKLSDQTMTQLNYEDIYFDYAIVNYMLEIYLVNGLGNSALPAANGSIKAIYTISINKFNYV